MASCKITVLKKYYDAELAAAYCQNPDPGPCAVFQEGQEILIDEDAYFSLQIPGGFCSEAWQALDHYIYCALQGGPLMKGWMKDETVMISCCNDGVRPVVFCIERVED